MTWLFLLIHWFSFDHSTKLNVALLYAFIAALFLGLAFEWVFRGIFLGLLLRSLRPGIALTLSSLIFACIHFLFPSHHFDLQNPGNADAGFRFIKESLFQVIQNPGYSFGFISLFFCGLILAYTRYQTASLALSIGLQTGWCFVFLLSHSLIDFTHAEFKQVELIIGADRRSGLLPLCFLVATGLLTHVFVQITTNNQKKP